MPGPDSAISVPQNWILEPTEGSLFAGQTMATGVPAPINATAKRLLIGGDGDLFVIPVGSTAAAGVEWGPVVAGMQIDVQCVGIGSSNTCTVSNAQFT